MSDNDPLRIAGERGPLDLAQALDHDAVVCDLGPISKLARCSDDLVELDHCVVGEDDMKATGVNDYRTVDNANSPSWRRR
jgi:hypothetical protein